MGQSTQGLVATIRRAIINYGEFAHEEVESTVLAALNDLDADLEEGGYAQSSRADTAVEAMEAAMSTADEAREAKEAEEKEEKDPE